MRNAIIFLIILSFPCFAQLPVRVVGSASGTNAPLQLDASTYAIEMIEPSHHKIHDGSHYFIEGYQFLTGSGDSLIFLFNVNDVTAWPHMLFDFDLNGAVSAAMYEGAANGEGVPIDTLTTRMTPINNNRNSSNTSAHDIFWGQTLSDFVDTDSIGTILWSDSTDTGGGNPNSPNPGHVSGRDNEMILKQNTSYLWIIVAKENDVLARFRSSWYEHTDKQ